MINTSSSSYFLAFVLSLLIFLINEPVAGQTSFGIFQENQKYGLKSEADKILIPPQFEKLGWSKGLDIPVDNVLGYYDNGWGMVTTSNKKITLAKYYSLEAIHKNMIIASIKGKFSNELFYGVLNSKGNVIINFKYHYLKPLYDLFIVAERRGGKIYYGLLNQQDEIFVPLNYDDISYYKNNLFIYQNAQNKKGIINRDGVILLEATLDSIAPSNNNFSLVFQSGEVGAIDSTGRYIHKPKYKAISEKLDIIKFNQYELRSATDSLVRVISCDSIRELSPDIIAVTRNESMEILDKDFNSIYQVDNLVDFYAFQQSIIYRKDGKFHLIKGSGEAIEKSGLDTLIFDQNYLYGHVENYWKIYNGYGSDLSKWKFDSVLTGSNKLIPVMKNGYWGYLDHSGKISISIKYDKVSHFTGNIAAVNYLGSNYIINQFGEILDNLSFDSIQIEQNNMALVTTGNRIDLIDNRGEILFQTFNSLSSHPFGYLEKTDLGKWGVISHFGEVILTPEYDSISAPISRRYLEVRKGNKKGLINFKGNWLIQMTEAYQGFYHISENLIGIKKNNQFGFIDYNQRLIVANRYAAIQPFSNHIASVKINGKWGCINAKEELIIQPIFQEMWSFQNGLALVTRKGKFGAIDAKGNELIKLEYDDISTTDHGSLLAKKNNKTGLFDKFGQVILQPSYTKISPTNDGRFIVERRGLMGLINASGKYTIPLKYLSVKEMSNDLYLCLPNK